MEDKAAVRVLVAAAMVGHPEEEILVDAVTGEALLRPPPVVDMVVQKPISIQVLVYVLQQLVGSKLVVHGDDEKMNVRLNGKCLRRRGHTEVGYTTPQAVVSAIKLAVRQVALGVPQVPNVVATDISA